MRSRTVGTRHPLLGRQSARAKRRNTGSNRGAYFCVSASTTSRSYRVAVRYRLPARLFQWTNLAKTYPPPKHPGEVYSWPKRVSADHREEITNRWHVADIKSRR